MRSVHGERGDLERRLGYEFRDRSLLEDALTHPSAIPAGIVRTGERLEFLGDAVLDLAIADLLLKRFPEDNEGVLSKCRSRLVCTASLAKKSRQLGLGEALQLGRGEDQSGGRQKPSILANTYEAVLGAIFSDAGFHRTRAVIKRHFKRELEAPDVLETRDWKTRLQEQTQARWRVLPEYRHAPGEGPAHARRFCVEVWVGAEMLASGAGASKREAEQRAAECALDTLQLSDFSIDEQSVNES